MIMEHFNLVILATTDISELRVHVKYKIHKDN